ncbi:MAG: OpgC domain-containing protein [Bacteroidota bacterium]|nr:OpgC domain-containing protein [Bacteroidota bacterium]
MTIDHLESPFYKITFSPFGFFSSALGFVFLSGIVAGIVAQKNEKKPFNQLVKTFQKRAFTIYKYHIIIYLILYSIGLYFYFQGIKISSFNSFSLDGPIIIKLLLGALLINQPRFLDILPMYFWFILMLPLVVKLVKQGKALLLFIFSGTVYLLAQYFNSFQLQMDLSKRSYIELGYFDIFAWQFIFILGIILGMFYEMGSLHFLKNKKIMIAAAILILFSTMVRRTTLLDLDSGYGLLFSDFVRYGLSDFGKLKILHFLNFSIFTVLIFNLIQFKFINLSNKWVNLLGQNSLQVFSLHIFLVYIGIILKEYLKKSILESSFVIIDLLITILSVFILFLFVHYRFNKTLKVSLVPNKV